MWERHRHYNHQDWNLKKNSSTHGTCLLFNSNVFDSVCIFLQFSSLLSHCVTVSHEMFRFTFELEKLQPLQAPGLALCFRFYYVKLKREISWPKVMCTSNYSTASDYWHVFPKSNVHIFLNDGIRHNRTDEEEHFRQYLWSRELWPIIFIHSKCLHASSSNNLLLKFTFQY